MFYMLETFNNGPHIKYFVYFSQKYYFTVISQIHMCSFSVILTDVFEFYACCGRYLKYIHMWFWKTKLVYKKNDNKVQFLQFFLFMCPISWNLSNQNTKKIRRLNTEMFKFYNGLFYFRKISIIRQNIA
jgi:hypothetical protein